MNETPFSPQHVRVTNRSQVPHRKNMSSSSSGNSSKENEQTKKSMQDLSLRSVRNTPGNISPKTPKASNKRSALRSPSAVAGATVWG